jgi:hypothetical protein
MIHNHLLFLLLSSLTLLIVGTTASAAPLVLNANVMASDGGPPFQLGTTRNPGGKELTADRVSLLVDGKPWMGAMGEFHFSRVPEAEWRTELQKMKAGGLDVVASYVFWIHHEEVEGKWDWTGQKNLREFVTVAGQVGLKVVIRCGPWAHGECRNGGFPDWMMNKGFKLRSSDPAYLAEVNKLYQQIGRQLTGLLWKDGGPVIGVQVENEYWGPSSYMLQLKQMARDAGMDVPLYTRTGWPAPKTPYPPNQLLPMFGGYPAGFWERPISPDTVANGKNYLFLHLRIDSEIGTDQLGKLPTTEPATAQSYPYLCCEMGGGMMTSYHRRIRIDPRDIYSASLIKLASGANLLGYYMYHGGMNPDGQLSTLQESQATKYPNDLPVKSYDFQAPLGEYGQVRPHYAMLRELHLFLRDFGSELARMPMVLPEIRPDNASDTQITRWAVRTDGDAGFLFVNNYQRLHPQPAKPEVQFEVHLRGQTLRIPSQPLTIPSDESFFWPFNLDLGGAKLIYATAQPICRLVQGKTTYAIFAQTPGVAPEFVIDPAGGSVESTSGHTETADGKAIIRNPKTGTDAAIRVRGSDGRESVIILLDPQAALTCWKGQLAGQDVMCLSNANLTFDGNNLNLTYDDPAALSVSLFPAPASLTINGQPAIGKPDGLFREFSASAAAVAPIAVTTEIVQPAGPAREIHKGHGKVAEAPDDADFAAAAVWRIKLPTDTSPDRDILLRIHYTGDVARLYLDGKLIDDNFYNGTPFDLGVKRFGFDIYKKELLLKVLPLRKDAPIYLPAEAWPKFEGGPSTAALQQIDVIENQSAQFALSGTKTPS